MLSIIYFYQMYFLVIQLLFGNTNAFNDLLSYAYQSHDFHKLHTWHQCHSKWGSSALPWGKYSLWQTTINTYIISFSLQQLFLKKSNIKLENAIIYLILFINYILLAINCYEKIYDHLWDRGVTASINEH